MDDNVVHGKGPRVDHEDRDVNVRAVIWFGVALMVVAVVVHFALFYLFGVFRRHEAPRDLPLSMIKNGRPISAPEPRLQYDPPKDLEEMRAEEQKVLDGYGWADPQAQTVHIPITQAIKLAIQKGMYVEQTGTGAVPVVQPVVTGGEGSGTQTQPAPQTPKSAPSQGAVHP